MKLYKEGLEKYPIWSAIVSNLAMLLWIESGTFAFWMLHPVAGAIFGVLGVLGVYIYLRWAVCRHCWYYGKRCSTGWGIISAGLFSKGDEARFTDKSLLAHIFSVYGFLMVAPLVILVVMMIRSFAMIHLYTLIAMVLFSMLSGFILRRPSCAKCKQRTICPGCASPLKQ